MFIIEDDHNEKFGYYLNTKIIDKYGYWISTNTQSFEFNIESNGRLKSMMKFSIKNTNRGYFLNDKSDELLISLGNIILYKENNRYISYCIQREELYDYQGIPNAVCGRTNYQDENGKWKGEFFTPLRIQIIQMEMTEEQKQNDE